LVVGVSDPADTVEIFVRVWLANNQSAQLTAFDFANDG
jgi:hypothetical protein